MSTAIDYFGIAKDLSRKAALQAQIDFLTAEMKTRPHYEAAGYSHRILNLLVKQRQAV